MRIIFATEYYHPWTPGGSATSIRDLAEAFADRGHHISVVTPNYGATSSLGGVVPASEIHNGVHVVRFPFWGRLRRDGLARARSLLNPAFHAAFAYAIAREAGYRGADVVHAQEKHAIAATYLAGLACRIPTFATLRDVGVICPIATCLISHSFVPKECGQRMLQQTCAPFFMDHYAHKGTIRTRAALAVRYLDARMKAAMLRRMRGVIGLSARHLDICEKALGLVRTHVVPNVYAPPAAHEPPIGRVTPPRILMVGKVTLGKGFPVLVAAASRVKEAWPAAEFMAVGACDVSHLRHVAGPVRLMGQCSAGTVRKLYQEASIVVQPSLSPEASSRVPLEAAAAARPVIVSSAGGGQESVEHRVTGLVVPPGNDEELANAIMELLKDPDYAARLGVRAKERAHERFNPDTIVSKLLSVYEESVR